MIQSSVWQTYIQLAVAANKNGQVQIGEKMISAALYEAQQQGASTATFAQALNELAYIYYQRGKFRRAQETLRCGLEMYEKMQGASDLQVASITLNLAELYFSRGKEREARVLYERYVAIVENLSGADDPLLERPLTKLAWLNSKRGRFELAHKLYLRALKIRAKISTTDEVGYKKSSLPLLPQQDLIPG